MKRLISAILIVCPVLVLAVACGQKAPTWQEQYDLGVRYLEDGSYDEAIIAFTAAIEIDPMQAEIYFGRAAVYVQLGEYELALTDCEAAVAIDETDDSAYAKAAEICLSMGDTARAIEFLQRGLERTDSEKLQDRLNELVETILYDALDEQSKRAVSTEPFLISTGTDVYSFPAEIYGWINGAVLDADKDGQAELLSLFLEEDGLILRKYEIDNTGGGVSETALGTLPALGYCDQMDVMLFYSPTLDCYCIAVSDVYIGSYTGVQGFNAWLYTIELDGISQYHMWDWNSFVHGWEYLDELQAEMVNVGWPYMDNSYLSFRDEASLASCTWLLRTELDITDGILPTEYVRYLRFLSPEELAGLPEW